MTFSPSRCSITNISNANPAVVTTSTDHGFLAGSYITFFIPYNTMQALNYNTYLATPLSPTTFSIPVNTIFMDPFVASATQSAQVIPAGEIASTLANSVRNIS